jgi:hypothetical protein
MDGGTAAVHNMFSLDNASAPTEMECTRLSDLETVTRIR